MNITLEEDIEAAQKQIKKLLERVRDIKELWEKDNRSISQERVKELLDIEKLLIDLNQLCESPKDDKTTIVVAQFYE